MRAKQWWLCLVLTGATLVAAVKPASRTNQAIRDDGRISASFASDVPTSLLEKAASSEQEVFVERLALPELTPDPLRAGAGRATGLGNPSVVAAPRFQQIRHKVADRQQKGPSDAKPLNGDGPLIPSKVFVAPEGKAQAPMRTAKQIFQDHLSEDVGGHEGVDADGKAILDAAQARLDTIAQGTSDLKYDKDHLEKLAPRVQQKFNARNDFYPAEEVKKEVYGLHERLERRKPWQWVREMSQNEVDQKEKRELKGHDPPMNMEQLRTDFFNSDEGKRLRRDGVRALEDKYKPLDERVMSADDIEDCVACLFVWAQVEMDIGRVRFEAPVYDAFQRNCGDAQQTTIFYIACEDMRDVLDDMVTAYLRGVTAPRLCEQNHICRESRRHDPGNPGSPVRPKAAERNFMEKLTGDIKEEP